MKTFRFFLLLVSVLLLSAQCQKPEDLDIKPKTRIIQKWACMGFDTNIRPYDPGDRLELWSDSTYKVYTDSILKGEGTYSLYTKTDYDWHGNPFVVPIISMTGYDLEYWLFGYNVETYETECAYYRFIGDSACPPTISWLNVPEDIQDTIASYNLSDEVLVLFILASTGPSINFIKIIN